MRVAFQQFSHSNNWMINSLRLFGFRDFSSIIDLKTYGSVIMFFIWWSNTVKIIWQAHQAIGEDFVVSKSLDLMGGQMINDILNYRMHARNTVTWLTI